MQPASYSDVPGIKILININKATLILNLSWGEAFQVDRYQALCRSEPRNTTAHIVSPLVLTWFCSARFGSYLAGFVELLLHSGDGHLDGSKRRTCCCYRPGPDSLQPDYDALSPRGEFLQGPAHTSATTTRQGPEIWTGNNSV